MRCGAVSGHAGMDRSKDLNPVPTIDLTDEQLETVIRIMRRAIDEDRYPLSDCVRTWKATLAKLDPSSVRPTPEPKPPLSPTAGPLRGNRRGGRR